jgi:dihydroorotate dehydrogenase
MPLYDRFLRALLFLLEPETAHNLALGAVRRGLVTAGAPDGRDRSRSLFSVKFPNPVGLAAGFDKDGVAFEKWRDLGFGHVELGTVTRYPQPGNPRPRVFRLPAHRAVINRLGFNNRGADAMAKQLAGKSAGIPVGINIGKSKATPIEKAAEDYAYSYKLLKGFADYVVVNVSSPNTPGLRDLQDKEALTRILSELKSVDDRKPLFVKIAPDLTPGALEDVVSVATQLKLTGIVATNTTDSRETLPTDPGIEGGLSGAPLTSMADEALRFVRGLSSELVLIGVGGVMTPADAKRKLSLGADLVQVYTGWVYAGPGFVREILRTI